MSFSRFARAFSALTIGALTFVFILSALEALLLRQRTTLASRFPTAVLSLSYLCALAGTFACERPRLREERRLWLVALGASVLALVVCAQLSRLIVDASWDGLAYHQPAIYELRAGWNPTREPKDVQLFANFVWANHYPKGAWLCSATLFGVFGDIQAGKLSFLLAMTSLAALWPMLGSIGLAPLPRTVVALILVLNPVAICQAWQFYVDGVLYYAVVLMVVAAVGYARERQWLDLMTMLLAALFATGVKFTGVVYAGLVLAWLLVDLWLDRQRPARSFSPLVLALAGWSVLFVLVGWSPYVQHVLSWRHPFYPLFGEGKIDIITSMLPLEFNGHGWWWRLWNAHADFGLSPFSPMALHRQLWLVDGIGNLTCAGVYMALGRLFIFACIIALPVCVLRLIRRGNRRIAIALVAYGLLALLNPAAWWARYSPCLWAMPLVLCLPSLVLPGRQLERAAVGIVLFLTGMTSYLYSGQCWFEQRTRAIEETKGLTALAQGLTKNHPWEVATSDFAAYVYQLRRSGHDLRWIPKDRLSCPVPARLASLWLCPVSPGSR